MLEREDQRRLCDTLESIADQLPEMIEPELCMAVYNSLELNLPVYHRNEEALYAVILDNAPAGQTLDSAVEIAKKEHRIHHGYAHEFHEFMNNQNIYGFNPDMYGYMLRGFFEAIRSHLAWEDATLIPFTNHNLTPADLDLLSKTITHPTSRIAQH